MADSILGRGVMEFGGDDRQFQQMATRVEQAMKVVSARMREASSVIEEGWGKADKSIDKTGNRLENTIIKFGKLSLANTAARSVATAMEEMASKVQAGEASFSELFDKAAKGVPLVGGFYALASAVAQLAVDGNASAEAMKRMSAEMEKQIGLTAKLVESHQKATQGQRDQAQRLGVGLAGQNVGAVASALFGDEDATKATADRVRQQVRATFKEQFDALDKLKRENDLVIQRQKTTPIEGGDFFDAGKLRDAQKNAAELEEMANQLRQDVTAAEDAALAKIGGGAFVQLGKVLETKVAGGFDAVTASVKRFLDRSREVSDETKKLSEVFAKAQLERGGGIATFNAQNLGLGIDLKRGNIGQGTFNQLSAKAAFDQVARSVESFIKSNAPAVQNAANFFSSGFLGPIRNLGIGTALGNLGSLLPGSINTDKPKLSANLSGLTELGSRIQASAAGGDPVVKKLDEMKDFGRRTSKNTADIVELMKKGGGGRAIVSKP